MRDWCFVLETSSSGAAKEIGRALRNENLDIDVMPRVAQVWCYAGNEATVRAAEMRVREILSRASLWEGTLQSEPNIRVWSEERHLYVDPERPGEDPDTGEIWIDSDLDPAEVSWRIRLELASVFDFRRVRRQLPALRRPVIETGNRSIDLGARDEQDATEVAELARRLDGVAAVTTHAVGGRLKRWWLRQRLAGNYSNADDGSGARTYYFDFGGHGGAGGGDGGGGHGGGGGGHGH
jgi:hypothetical protein